MKKVQKRIITAALLTAGLILLLALASQLFMPKGNDPDSGMEEVSANGILGEKPGTVDVLILGDSEALCSFIPLQMWKDEGYTVYNSASLEQRLDYSYTLLKRAFRDQKIKVVFLEANAIYRKDSKEIPYQMLCDRIPVFRYHNRWKSLKRDDFSFDEPSYKWTDPNKGYDYSTEIEAAGDTDYYTEESDEVSRITLQNRRYLKKMKKLCDRNGAKLVLISAPSPSNWVPRRHNGSSAAAADLGIEFIDMNMVPEETRIDWSVDTRDGGDHLNYTGAVKATGFLTDYLKKTGSLKSHKDDPVYADWNDALMQFENSITPRP